MYRVVQCLLYASLYRVVYYDGLMQDAAESRGRLDAVRRAALVEATVAEIAAVGYESASLNRIIRAAGMGKSSFYHFVGSKSELLDVVMNDVIEAARAAWSPPAPESFDAPDFWARVDALLADLGRAAAAEPALQLLGDLFAAPPASTGDATTARAARERLLADIAGWMHEVLDAGRRADQVRDDMPLDLQRQIVFAMLNAVDTWVLARGAHRAPHPPVDAALPADLLRRVLLPG